MNCPNDRTPLLSHKRAGVDVQTCLQCHGVWFSRAALDALAPRPATAPAAAPASGATVLLRRWACPVCDASQMRTQMRGEVQITHCPNCRGVWLAQSEVTKILVVHQRRQNAEQSGAPAADPYGPATEFAVEAAGRASWMVAGEAGDSCAVLAEFLTVWT